MLKHHPCVERNIFVGNARKDELSAGIELVYRLICGYAGGVSADSLNRNGHSRKSVDIVRVINICEVEHIKLFFVQTDNVHLAAEAVFCDEGDDVSHYAVAPDGNALDAVALGEACTPHGAAADGDKLRKDGLRTDSVRDWNHVFVLKVDKLL